MQVRVQVHVAGEVTHEGCALLLDHPLEDFSQERKVVRSLVFGHLLQALGGRVRVDHKVEQLTGRGLTTFVHPVCRQERARKADGQRVGAPQQRDQSNGRAYSPGRRRACRVPTSARRPARDSGQCGRYSFRRSQRVGDASRRRRRSGSPPSERRRCRSSPRSCRVGRTISASGVRT